METPALQAHAANSRGNFDVMADLAGRMTNPTLVQVTDTTHVIPVDNADGLVEVLLPFL